MPLRDDIEALCDRILADLASSHDYYANTKQAWRVVQLYIDSGKSVEFFNVHTGNNIPAAALPAQSQFYVDTYLASATFQQFVSLLEDFVLGLLRLWLRSFPHRLENRKLAASVVFAAKDIEEAREQVVQQQVLDVAYKPLPDWFAFLNSLVNLSHPSKEEIERLAEIKASRDVLVHNRGVVNTIYVEKAGVYKRFDAGAEIEIPEPYHLECWNLIRKIVSEMTADALARAPG
jgi:hypothetical protein